MCTPKEGYGLVDLHNDVLVYKSFYVILPMFGCVNYIENIYVPYKVSQLFNVYSEETQYVRSENRSVQKLKLVLSRTAATDNRYTATFCSIQRQRWFYYRLG